ncbi:sulfatase-like hydrolase/transferase [Paralcaligenes sp. KSB-10]|uniref:sulfatase family protein n=1 Tax=Paralcaligenes sp. KSB-10 TaxID=2901142 RepID=UPI001E2C612F|nr:sulfatase-like hydrolase/transferase [Paralcaligenes sp. KSB-10]UHL63102.1 sulfatase-like hydrolase/transferase [Paralcaligenes sp. KSB-10]
MSVGSDAPVNFLFFITDQQRADHLGCYGNPVVKTPNLDTLARRASQFNNMHVATPICMPNRASLMTGRFPSTHGARHNGIPLSLQAMTFVESLRQAGYRTALVGKAHLQNMTLRPPVWPVPLESRLKQEAMRATPGNYDQERRKYWLSSDDFDLDYPYYGFEQARLVDEHSDEVHGHYRYWLRKHYPELERHVGPDGAMPTPGYALSKIRQAWRTRLPEEIYPSAYIADRGMDYLREFAAQGQPFFLKCSFPDPHHPFTPPGKYWDMYDPAQMELPPSFHGTPTSVPPHVKWLYDQRDSGKAIKNTPAIFACNEQEAKEALALNYGSISNIDHQIGRVLGELDRLGLSRNTVVVFTSDHGDYLGDHQLMLKGPIHYRGLTRVPFLWAEPEGAAKTLNSDSLVSTVDIAPTVLNRAGVAPYNGIQGHSLMPVMAGADTQLRDALIIEEEGQRVILGFNTRIRCRTLLANDCRVTIYDGANWGELYNLAEDPNELNNLWSDSSSACLRAKMLEKLAYMMLNHVDTSPYPTALA